MESKQRLLEPQLVQTGRADQFSRKVFCDGMRDGVPIALGYFAVSFSLGIAARKAGFTPFQGFLVSLLNNASAGEYAAFALIMANATYFEVAVITLIANARYLLIVLAVFLLAVCLFLFIFLLCSMGHKEGVDGIYQCWLNKIPLDLFLALLFALFFAWAAFLSDIWYIDFWYYILLAFGAAALVLTGHGEGRERRWRLSAKNTERRCRCSSETRARGPGC